MIKSRSRNAPWALTAAAVVCSAVGVALLWTRRRQKTEPAPRDEISVDLLDVEKILAMGGGGDNSMPTLTWFQGNVRQAEGLLRKRAMEILNENPWLGGRVVKRKGTYVLVYSPSKTMENFGDYFECIQDEKLSRDVPLDQLGATLKPLMLKNGPTQVLWKVSIIPCHKNPETTFALVCSMSHIIADGATYYKILNMLNFAEPLEKLEATRFKDTQEQQIQALGKSEYSILQSPAFIVNCVGGVLKSKLFGPPPQSRMFLVDEVGMKKAKRIAAQQEGLPYVSTNDVLTSWFLHNSSCKHGMMALNFRGRLEGHSELLAGNYENVLFYQQADAASPGLIRNSLLQQEGAFVRTVTKNEPMPTFYEIATGSVAMATNWSSFAKPSALKGCKENMHVPIHDFASVVPSTMAVMCIFRAGPRGLGIFLVGTPDKLEGLQNAPFLSKEALV